MENVDAVFLDFNGGVGDLIMYYYGWVRMDDERIVYSPDFQMLRHFKELHPDVKIFMAEGCYSQKAALALLDYFPYIDYFIYRSDLKYEDIHNFNDRNAPKIWEKRGELKYGWITNHLTNNLMNQDAGKVWLFNALYEKVDLGLEVDKPTMMLSKKDYEGVTAFENQEFITVHPFSAGPFRSCEFIPEINGYNNFPSFSYARLIYMLAENDQKVVLLGSENERLELDEHPNIFDMCGKLTIRQSCYLVEKSSVFVGSNSCLSCIPFALKKPTIIITPSYDFTGNKHGNNMTENKFRGPQLDVWLTRPKPKWLYVYYERPSVLTKLNPSHVMGKVLELLRGVPPKGDPAKMHLTLR